MSGVIIIKRSYSIVTNRKLIGEYVSTYIDEIENMQTNHNQEVVFNVIDESPKDVQDYNRQLLDDYKNSDIKMIFFDSSKQQHLFEYMQKYLDDDVVSLLNYDGFSYSRAMNKQFMLSNIIHADFLHRRDSDVRIMKDKFGFPSDIEIKFLGKKVSETDNEDIGNRESHKDDQIIYLVGSGYSGNSDWKADFGALKDSDFNLIAEIAGLFNYGDKLSKEYLNEIVTGDVSINKELVYLPNKNHPNPICGNISYYDIFNYMPCCTVLSTIGSDNLIRTFLKRLNSPIVYHNNFVYHKFSDNRNNNDIKYIKSYWPRLINKLIYYRAIEKIIINGAKEKYTDFCDLDNISFSNIMNMDIADFKSIEKICYECIDSFKEIISKANNPLMQEFYKYIDNEEFYNETVNNMYTGLKNGDILLKKWGEIINVCRDYGEKYKDKIYS